MYTYEIDFALGKDWDAPFAIMIRKDDRRDFSIWLPRDLLIMERFFELEEACDDYKACVRIAFDECKERGLIPH